MLRLALAAALALASSALAQPLSTAFTFQGELASAGSPATGTYDFKFLLFDAPNRRHTTRLAALLRQHLRGQRPRHCPA